jgi:hypothetical protein
MGLFLGAFVPMDSANDGGFAPANIGFACFSCALGALPAGAKVPADDSGAFAPLSMNGPDKHSSDCFRRKILKILRN